MERGGQQQELKDARLLARVKKLALAEYAGLNHEGGDTCLEPGCSCATNWKKRSDPVCGIFRKPAMRCTTFESVVLGLDPDDLEKQPHADSVDVTLAEAYTRHLLTGEPVSFDVCMWEQCRKTAIDGPYCAGHATVAARQERKERQRSKAESQAG